MLSPIRHAFSFSFAGLGALLLLSSLTPGASAGEDRCTTDAECNDGAFCNGVERCRPKKGTSYKVCKRGKKVNCNDGISCTKDSCNESRDECSYKAIDRDGDGHGDAKCKNRRGETMGDDCDDRNANRYPGNLEVCDAKNVDEDCDPKTYGNKDSDGDGFIDMACCNKNSGPPTKKKGKSRLPKYRYCGDDCDDKDPDVHPTQAEVCNGKDDNCRRGKDEGVKARVYRDADHDLYGDPRKSKLMCLQHMGNDWVQNSLDCNDKDAKMTPIEGCPPPKKVIIR